MCDRVIFVIIRSLDLNGPAKGKRVGAVTTEPSQEAKKISVPVYNREGGQTGTIEVDASEFGGKINRQLLHDACVMFLANQRAGTHSTLRRGEVAGSTKKLFRQKGTGNARAGTRRTNKRRGGGTAKGPKPRDYSYALPKKVLRAATRMAILSKLLDNEAVIVETLDLPQVKTTKGEPMIKTKEMAKLLRSLQVHGITTLIGTGNLPQVAADEKDDTKKKAASDARAAHGVLYRSARNIEGVKMMTVGDFNAYTVLRQKRLVLTRAAFDELRKTK